MRKSVFKIDLWRDEIMCLHLGWAQHYHNIEHKERLDYYHNIPYDYHNIVLECLKVWISEGH